MQLSRIGPFALEEPLGGLPTNNVVRGVHVQQGATAAVKLLDRKLVADPLQGKQWLADVKALRKLNHPGVARVFGGGVEQGQPYLALEFVEGESLRNRLDRRGRIPWETAVDLAEQICAALHQAHREGIVHGRLTPARILVTSDDAIKLIGFDCAWVDRDDVVGLRAPMSTTHYLAPEAFRGKKSSRLPTVDLFSAGVVIYECLTGELPWRAETPTELIRARFAAPAPRASSNVLDCPVWLDVLIARLLERKRQDRLASADAARRAIVDARRKVAEGMGTVQHAWSGKQGALSIDKDRQELRALRKKSAAPRAHDGGPFYERAWFLATCLALVVAGGAWSLRPASEDALFAKALPLMQTDDPTAWRRAKDQYLSELLERFPKTGYAAQIDQFEDRYAMHRAREKVKNIDRFGRLPKTEAERRYAEGWRDERAGDRLSAWRQYEALAVLLSEASDREDRAFRALALEGVERIRAEIGVQGNPAEFLSEQLARAADLKTQGNSLKAREVLRSVVALYADNRELRGWVQQARDQLDALDAPSP